MGTNAIARQSARAAALFAFKPTVQRVAQRRRSGGHFLLQRRAFFFQVKRRRARRAVIGLRPKVPPK